MVYASKAYCYVGDVMTLILALKWIVDGKEGIVVSSDSKATVGPVSYEVRKVYPIILKAEGKYVPLAVAGGAGLAVRDWNKRTPSFEQFEEAVGHVESSFIQRFRGLLIWEFVGNGKILHASHGHQQLYD
jgi:hypothetical protein